MGQKHKKTPLVACCLYLVLICTCFWLNVNRYTFFWHLPINQVSISVIPPPPPQAFPPKILTASSLFLLVVAL